ncbi:riboflavin synthase [Idiomarina tyrosinivorans]|uniref:Riboflavin synthase n=1 Tax=Idiomarina tyrosinivorans TaxID=1445662 RepID=A0A432ZU00_9GAMM|nr:riboflavin synthase subunit alpha [Idiomarina tyrosinivorans]RUO81415.1 riboflavin synthase [Idiomarina tyrosinivorans]
MFTGIVQTQATVHAITDKHEFRQLTLKVEPQFLIALEKGASIAINGCCLTAVAFDDSHVQFDVIDETLRLTNLGQLQQGDNVNFERSLKVGDEIGGHHVSGHIHTVGKVVDVRKSEDNWAIWIELPEPHQEYLFSKGFIAVNGASLTVGEVDGNRFSLHLIPETLRLTNLAQAQPGSALNIEMDQQTMTIVATVKRMLQRDGLQ